MSMLINANQPEITKRICSTAILYLAMVTNVDDEYTLKERFLCVPCAKSPALQLTHCRLLPSIKSSQSRGQDPTCSHLIYK